MARFVNIEVPVQHGGITRVTNGLAVIGQLSITRAVLSGLAVVGAPVTRGLAAWSAARKQRREDEKLWNVALSDARVMADLSRAMSQDALRDSRGYY